MDKGDCFVTMDFGYLLNYDVFKSKIDQEYFKLDTIFVIKKYKFLIFKFIIHDSF